MRGLLLLALFSVSAFAENPEISREYYPLFSGGNLTYQLSQSYGLMIKSDDGREEKVVLGKGAKGTATFTLMGSQNPKFAAKTQRFSLKDGNGDVWEPLQEGVSMKAEMELPLEINFLTAGAMAYLYDLQYALTEAIDCVSDRVSIKDIEKNVAAPYAPLVSRVYHLNLPGLVADVSVDTSYVNNFVGSNNVLRVDVATLDGYKTTLSPAAPKIEFKKVQLPVAIAVWASRRSSRVVPQVDDYDVEFTIKATPSARTK